MEHLKNDHEANNNLEPPLDDPGVIEIDVTHMVTALIIVLLIGIGTLGLLAMNRRDVAASAHVAAPRAAAASSSRLRKFYLTDDAFPPYDALSTCAEGYHFASMWEIIDPTNLQYAYDHPDAFIGNLDSGEGPPSYEAGWVRTGYDSNNSNTAGMANCSLWSTDSGYGTEAHLTRNWTYNSQNLSDIWIIAALDCDMDIFIWCVEN